MKKLLFALIAFTMLTTSCYKKDFENLNQKLDAQAASLATLSTQVTSIATLVAGIPALQTSINTLQTSVTAISTSLAALTTTVNGMNTTVNAINTSVNGLTTSLAALTTTVNTINTNLNTLAANVAANQVTTVGLLNSLQTQAATNQANLVALINSTRTSLEASIAAGNTAVINSLTATITAAQTALAAAIASSEASVIANSNTNTTTILNAITASAAALEAAIQVQINTLETNLLNAIAAGNAAVIAQLQNDIAIATATLNASIAAAQAAIIANNDAQTASLTNLINAVSNALLAQLAIANAQLATLVNSNNFYLGDLTITNEAELVYAESLGAKVRAITGNVYIDATTFSGPQMARLKNVTNNTDVLPANAQNPWIGTVVGNVTVNGSQVVDLSRLIIVSGNVNVNTVTAGGAGHNLSALLTITGNYTIGNAGAAGANPMDDALITVGGNMWIKHSNGYSYPNLTSVAGVLTPFHLGATTAIISFPVLNSNVNMNDGDGNGVSPNGFLTYPNAATVHIGASSGLYNLQVAIASWVILGEDVYAGGLIVWAPNASLVNLASMVNANGAINITTDGSPAGSVDFSNYTGSGNNNSVTVTGPVLLTMPKFVGNTAGQDIFSGTVTTAILAKYQLGGCDLLGMTVLENLTIGDLKNTLSAANVPADDLETLTVVGSAYPGAVVNLNTTYDNLVWVNTSGLLYGLFINDNDALTTITTAGTMDYLEVNDNQDLVTVNMGHNFYNNVLGDGTHITFDNNDALTSLTTSTGRMHVLEIRNNDDLANVDFSSFIVGQNIAAGLIRMHVHDNGLIGTYAPSIYASNTAPVMVQTGLSTLKAYLLNILANSPVPYTYEMRLSYSTLVSGVDNLPGLMDTDRGNHIADGGSAATTFVQRTGDTNDGAGNTALGSSINVARELNYLQ